MSDLAACPFCGSADRLSVIRLGSLTFDMPERPAAVICTHIDHDTVQGPTAYGEHAARAAWNRRAQPPPSWLTAEQGELLAQALANVLVKAGVIALDVGVTGPQLLMAAESYCEAPTAKKPHDPNAYRQALYPAPLPTDKSEER